MAGFPQLSGAYAARLGGTTAAAAKVPYYNVKDYGAKGDGVTDDTAAINAALSAAATTFGWVVFPAGTFIVATKDANHRYLAPPSLVNGLHIIGEGVGATIIKSTPTDYGYILSNTGNDAGWVVEGIEIQGPGSSVLQAAIQVAPATGVVSSTFGPGVIGFWGDYLANSILRDVKISGCNVGVWDHFGNFNEYRAWCRDNRNVGTVLEESQGVTIKGLNQTQNTDGAAGTSEVVANILCANQTAGHGGPSASHIDSAYIDEIGLNAPAGGQGLYVAAGTDIEVRSRQVFAGGKKQAAGNAYYGIRIGALSTRTHLRGVRVQPWQVDTTRVPDHTIIIDSGATGTVLDDVSTNPNAANGGGDISDSGTSTVYVNVRPNDGSAVNTSATKAGIPSDADYDVAPPVGTQVLDTTDGKIYYRTAAATWKAALLS